MANRWRTPREKRERALEFLREDVITALDNGARVDEVRNRVEVAIRKIRPDADVTTPPGVTP